MLENVSNKKRSILVGILILVAYGVLANLITSSATIIMVADVISGLAVIGISVLVYPLLKSNNKVSSMVYLILRIAEGALMIIAGIIYLSPEMQYLRPIIYSQIHIYTFLISGFIFYILLIKESLIPNYISIWGIAGLTTLSVSTLLKFLNIEISLINNMLILIISNEVYLAVWLFVKEFRVTTRNSE